MSETRGISLALKRLNIGPSLSFPYGHYTSRTCSEDGLLPFLISFDLMGTMNGVSRHIRLEGVLEMLWSRVK